MSEIVLRSGLPSDTTTEDLVLAAMFSDAEAAQQALDALTSDDFTVERSRLIFAAAQEVQNTKGAIDRHTVTMQLHDSGQLAKVGGMATMVGLGDSLPRVFDFDSYLERLQTKTTLRRAIRAANRLIVECCQQGAGVEAVREAEELLRKILAPDGGKRPENFEKFLEATGGLDRLIGSTADDGMIPSPWPMLNEIIGGGFRPGQKVIIAARPGEGKTVAGAQIAVTAARRGTGSVLFSLEMGKEEIWKRVLCNESQTHFGRLVHGRIDETERKHIARAASRMAEFPMFVDDASGRTIRSMTTSLRKHKAQHGLGLVVVDYLQLMEVSGRKDNRVQEVTELSRQLKLAAKEFKVPFIVLAQLNRAMEKDGRKPQLSDLRESGSIEQDADVVLMLYRDQKEKAAAIEERRPSKMEMLIRKQRNGPTGVVQILFDPRLMQIGSGE